MSDPTDSATAGELRIDGRYRIVRRLGRGSQGDVLLVADEHEQGQERALKLVPGIGHRERDRLAGEFRRLSACHHPALVRVYDLGVLSRPCAEWPAGTAFFTADHVAGQSPVAALAAAVDGMPSADRGSGDAHPADLLLTIAEDIAAALAHLHAAGLVHRDVKPANIMVRRAGQPDASAVLLDLGLAAARGLGQVRGTLAYMAPEALSGHVDPRSDLYGLGAALYHAVTGRPPFLATEPETLIRAICGRAIAAPAAAWLPPELRGVIMHLLERDPTDRPSLAQILLDELARARDALGRPRAIHSAVRHIGRYPASLLPPRLTARQDELDVLRSAFEATAQDHSQTEERPRLLRIIGESGHGRTALITTAVRDYQLAAAAALAAPVWFVRGTPETLTHGLLGAMAHDSEAGARQTWQQSAESELPAEGQAQRALYAWTDRLLAAAGARAPLVLLLDDCADDARCAALARAAMAGHPAFAAGLLLVVTSTATAERAESEPLAGVLDVPLAPLSASDTCAVVESMVGRPVARSWCARLAAVTRGSPRFIVEAVRTASARADAAQIESVSIDELMDELLDPAHGHSLTGLLTARFATLPADQADVLAALAVLGGSARASELAGMLKCEIAEVYARLATLRSRGFLADEQLAPPWTGADDPSDDSSGCRATDPPIEARMPSPAHTDAIHRAIPAARRTSLHRAALAMWHARDPDAPGARDPVARARHLVETGPVHRAAQACAEAARELWRRGDVERALVAVRYASERSSGQAAADNRILHARIATAAGRYDEAVEYAQGSVRSRAAGRRRQARFVLARALFKRGDLAAAERVLQALVAADEDGDDLAARGAFARLLVARGRHQDALRIASAADQDAESAPSDDADQLAGGRALCLESAGLARLYTGDLDAAERAFARLERAARAHDAQAILGRALSLRGMVEHARGRIADAADLYRRAGECARAAGEVHAAAVYDINQATAHSERGQFGAAMTALDRARDALLRLGSVAELAAAQFNRGIALLALGQIAAARRATREAHQYARAPRMRIYAHLLDGDTCRREGDRAGALAAYGRAYELAEAEEAPREHLLVLLELAVTQAEDNDRRALDLLARAAEVAHGPDDRDRLLLCRARVALTLGDDLKDVSALANSLAELAERTAASGRVDQAWRTEVMCARLARAHAADATAKRYCRQARARFEEMLAGAPEADREGMRGDPDAAALSALSAELDLRRDATATLASRTLDGLHSAAQLRRMLALSRRLNSQLSLQPLLADVIDTAIEMTAAERGFLLLRERGQLRVVVARNFDQASLDGQDARMSRSMAERAARTGEVVMTVDASFDERFETAESVVALRLRSVVAVPLRQKSSVIGTIYVDHRFRRSAFAEEAVECLQELADIAAVAIENARLVEESRRRQAEIVELNRRLQAEVVEKDTEIVRMRLSPSHNARAGLRHRYADIIGRSPAMLDMLRLIDRVAETSLPVVIFGESGTGKELVARALHESGDRRQGPFVPVNCGALPAQLLESELFGHVRGAFSGADRDRRGLFEVAHLGTLFLDEVADTSAAMQTRLLRVLQSGEIRRVGDTRVRRVDVRVVAASNRRLRELVARDQFREDLFYRLHVLAIDVPPLRERPQDIPLLCQHLLDRLVGDRPLPQLTERALQRLCGYSWPGNVRELENQLARAVALAGAIIDVDDLAPEIRAEARVAELDDLRIKPRVESLERELVAAAMKRTGDNQTAAARLLGMSRYGLQKKLKRYGMSSAREPTGPGDRSPDE